MIEVLGYELKVDNFPDGSFRYTVLDLPDEPPEQFTIVLKSTLPASVVAIMQVCVAIIEVHPVSEIELQIQTMPDQRADRSEERGQTVAAAAMSYLICALPISKLKVYDLHSPLVQQDFEAGCLYNNIKLEIVNAVDCFNMMLDNKKLNPQIDFVVAVDKGAIGRAEEIARVFNSHVIYADKKRVDGKIVGHTITTSTAVPKPGDNIWIVDDLCDGGATFISIAQKLRKTYQFNQLNLYVTHGLFSKGKTELNKYYDNVVALFDYGV